MGRAMQRAATAEALPLASEEAPAQPAVRTETRVKRLVRLILAFTAIFYLPSLAGGFMADDWYHRLALDHLREAFYDRLNLFGMIRSVEEVTAFKRFGLMPWWASDQVRINFYRPLPSITHWLEYQAFGNNPAAAHLVSIGFYVLSVYLVYRLLARFLPESRWALAVAVAVFALDDAHALNIEWIANRNETIGGSFVLLGLLAFMRHREGQGRHNAPLVALSYLGALLSKESGLVLPLFVLAHALVFPSKEGQGFWARLKPHAPLLAVLVAMSFAYVALYFGFGHGANSVYYINPMKNPGLWAAQFFRSGFYHAVILATGVPLHILSSTPVQDYPLAAVALGGVTLGFWAVALKWLRHERAFWFFLLTMIAGQVIVTTSFPDPRNLFLPSIGFAYLVARVIEEAYARWKERWTYRSLVVTLGSLHLLLAPVLCQVCIHIVNGFEGRYAVLRDSLARSIDYDHLPEEGVEVYFLNWHQREMTAVYGLYLRRVLPTGVSDYTPISEDPNLSYVDKLYKGLGAERIHYFSLSYLHGDVEVSVIGDREFVMRPKKGHFFPTLFEQLYTTGTPWQAGQEFAPGTMRATIEKVSPAGEVLEVRFSFPEPLTSKRYKFMKYDGEKFVPVEIGAERLVEAFIPALPPAIP